LHLDPHPSVGHRPPAVEPGGESTIAAGIYKKHGLDVALRQGGPQVNHAQLLAAGRLDFNEAPTSFIPLNFAAENIPYVVPDIAVERREDGSLLLRPEPERLSDVIRDSEGVVFKDEEFIAHLERVAATEDDLPAEDSK